MSSEVVDLDGDAVGGVVAGQEDVVPVGVHVLFRVRRFQTDPQAGKGVGVVRDVEDHRLQELGTLGAAHHDR